MKGIILVGHGKFASALTSSLKMIAGLPENYRFHDFTENMSQEDLLDKIKQSLEALSDCTEIILLSDMMGGTPFKSSVLLSLEDKRINLVTGINLPFLLSLALSISDERSATELVDSFIDESREALHHLLLESYI